MVVHVFVKSQKIFFQNLIFLKRMYEYFCDFTKSLQFQLRLEFPCLSNISDKNISVIGIIMILRTAKIIDPKGNALIVSSKPVRFTFFL